MIREIIGVKTIASMLTSKRRRKRSMMSNMSAIGILAGAGIAYMAMRKRNHEN